jgi:hypothetical protein
MVVQSVKQPAPKSKRKMLGRILPGVRQNSSK